MSSEIFIPDKGPSMKPMRARRRNKARPMKADKRDYAVGGRTSKIDDYVVHRIAEFILMADVMHQNEEARRNGMEVLTEEGKWIIADSLDQIAMEVGRFICGDVGGKHLNLEVRPYILRRLADVLERKRTRKRPADDIAKIRAAQRKCGDNATFKEIADQYREDTGFPLDRRALKDALK